MRVYNFICVFLLYKFHKNCFPVKLSVNVFVFMYVCVYKIRMQNFIGFADMGRSRYQYMFSNTQNIQSEQNTYIPNNNINIYKVLSTIRVASFFTVHNFLDYTARMLMAFHDFYMIINLRHYY